MRRPVSPSLKRAVAGPQRGRTFREHGFLSRLAAHLLIPLLVLSPLPPSVQADLVLLPLSLLLPSSAEAQEVPEGVPAERGESVTQDPLGNVTTFTRSEYVAEDGTTGIGPGGGTVRGEGGVELRIPEGALKKGATFKLALVDASELPTLFPNAQHETLAESLGAHHGSVLRLEASEGTRLEKEADLVFPLPDFTAVPEAERPTKPEDAFYYIHRRVERCADGSTTCPDPIVVFEVIDEARAEGEGANARVVTASPPFFAVAGLLGAVLLYTMSWSYEPSLLGLPRPGLIRGKALRTVWGSDGAAFEAVPDAQVTGTDAGGVALSSKDGGTFATSQGDGTYALWDYSFTGGTTRIDAALGEESASATAFEVSDGPGIGVYNKVAHANITFPPIEPPPTPPQVEIQVVQESTGSLISGLVVSGTTLQIGFRSNTPETEYTIYGARVAGQELAVRQAQQGDRPGWTHVVAETFTPTNPGTYTVEAAAAPGVGSPVNTSTTFRVIAEGGSVEIDPLSPPKVITARLHPKPNATGVPVTAFLNVAFTEPVRGIPGNVRLLAGEMEIPIRISGVTPEGQVIESVSDENETLTSLTIQPLAGLRYSTAYRLLLASGIMDLDPEPKALEPFELPFTTFGPTSVGGTTDYRNGSAGIVVLGDRAYLTRTNSFVNGNLVVFDITDPVEPVEVAMSAVFAPRPYDIVGEETDSGEKLIAVATGSTYRSMPASVQLFDASSSEVPQFVGAASLTSSAADGFTSRIAIHGGFVYSATVRKGIQGVEIQRAKNAWNDLASQPDPALARQKAKAKLNTDGEGFGHDAVVINLPIPLKSNATPYYLNDIKAADIAGQTLVAVTGEPGLILAQPFIAGITYQGRPEREGTRLDWGYALALGRLQDRDVAVVVGRGTIAGAATTLLITLDVSNPHAPLVLGAASLSAELGALVPVDILLKDSTALVGVQNSTGDQGFVLLVNLADLAMPEVSGRLEGVAGRLALDENGLLYGSARLSTGGSSVNGGVKTATLGKVTIISKITENPVLLALNRASVEPQTLKFRSIPPPDDEHTAQLQIVSGEQVVSRLPASMNAQGEGEVTLPAGYQYPVNQALTAQLVIDNGDPSAPRPLPKRLTGERFDIRPVGPEEVDIDGEPMAVAAVNAALVKRAANGTALPTLSWNAPGGLTNPPGYVPPAISTSGIYTTYVMATGTRGSRGPARLMSGNTVMAETGDLSFAPGQPFAGAIHTIAPPGAPPATAESVMVPADGTTIIPVFLDDVKDVYGNTVEDGLAVTWSVEGDDGRLLETASSQLIGGRTQVRYQAGIETRDVIIHAEAGEGVFRLQKSYRVVQVPVQITVTRLHFSFRAEVTSAAGVPADGTPIVWGTNRGTVSYQPQLTAGASTAAWDPRGIQPGYPAWRYVTLFASIGRSPRATIRYDTQETQAPLPGRPLVILDRERLLIDVPANSSSGGSAPSFTSSSVGESSATPIPDYDARATATVIGQPGETVQLHLGSTRFPVVEPVAAYALNEIDSDTGTTGDLYGGEPAVADPGVTVDSGDAFHQLGSFRFYGGGGVTLPGLGSLGAAGEFGFILWVRFDSLTEQTVLEKAGSYGLQLAAVEGQPRLQFHVLSGGVRKHVVSDESIDAEVWYRVAARVSGGRLELAVGDGEAVALGDTASAVDITASPVLLGAGLRGNVGEVAVYDFQAAAPMMAFEDGATVKDIVLDADGRAEVVVLSAASFSGSGETATGTSAAASSEPSPRPRPNGPFADRLRIVPLAVYTAPEPVDPMRPEYIPANIRAFLQIVTEQCAEGLASGESQDLGLACDMAAGFSPHLAVGQALRDTYVVGRHFVQGKQAFGDYIKGTFALLVILSSVVPGVRVLRGGFEKARAVVAGTEAEIVLARQALAKMQRVADGASETESLAVRILSNDAIDQEAKRAMVDLLGGCVVRVASMALPSIPSCAGLKQEVLDILEQVAPRFGNENFVRTLGRLRASGYSEEIVERLIRTLDVEALRGLHLSDNALEGLAVFLSHTKSANRLPRVWWQLRQHHQLAETRAQQIVEQLLLNLRTGEDGVRALSLTLPVGDAQALHRQWHNFVALGAGTPSTNSTAGFYHALEGVLRELPAGVVAIDAAFAGFAGRPDLIYRRLQGLLQKEFKVKVAGRLLEGREIAQLHANIDAAHDRALSSVAAIQDLTLSVALHDELSRVIYAFRGPPRADLRDQIYQEVLRVVGVKFKRAAEAMRDAVEFTGGTLPF